MKKISCALACIAVIASSTIAFAAPSALSSGAVTTSTAGPTIRGGADATAAQSTTTGVIIGRLSKGVKTVINFTTSAYALATKHDGGTNLYGTAFNSTSMYMKAVGSTALASGDVSATDSASFAGAGWTAM